MNFPRWFLPVAFLCAIADFGIALSIGIYIGYHLHG